MPSGVFGSQANLPDNNSGTKPGPGHRVVKQSSLRIDTGAVAEADLVKMNSEFAKGDVDEKNQNEIKSAAFRKYFDSRLRISSMAGKGRRTVKSKLSDAMTPVKSATTVVTSDSLLSK